jgi:hypothetical protein
MQDKPWYFNCMKTHCSCFSSYSRYFQSVWLLNGPIRPRCQQTLRLFRNNMARRAKKVVNEMIKHVGNIYINFQEPAKSKPYSQSSCWMNVHDQVSTKLPHSDSSIGGWSNAFIKRVSTAYSVITQSTDKFQREQSKFAIDIAQIWLGHEPKSKKNKHCLLRRKNAMASRWIW